MSGTLHDSIFGEPDYHDEGFANGSAKASHMYTLGAHRAWSLGLGA